MTSDRLAEMLALKAKELVHGMHVRVQRDPDIADFKAAFKPIIQAAVGDQCAQTNS